MPFWHLLDGASHQTPTLLNTNQLSSHYSTVSGTEPDGTENDTPSNPVSINMSDRQSDISSDNEQQHEISNPTIKHMKLKPDKTSSSSPPSSAPSSAEVTDAEEVSIGSSLLHYLFDSGFNQGG